YAGHGATDPNKGHFLTLDAGLLGRSQVRAAMGAKQAGLSILLTDCCSTLANLGPWTGAPPPPPEELKKKLMRDLFLRARGVVDITAATNDSAWGDQLTGGGVFTSALSMLVNNTDWHNLDTDHDGYVSWKEFFPELRSATEARGKQTPQAFELKTTVVPVAE